MSRFRRRNRPKQSLAQKIEENRRAEAYWAAMHGKPLHGEEKTDAWVKAYEAEERKPALTEHDLDWDGRGRIDGDS